jgi:hypothetical protein
MSNIYFANVYRVYLNGSSIKKLVSTHLYNPTALAYDWIHDLLYWTEAGTHSNNAKIEVLTVSTKWRRTLLVAPDVDCPTTLIVDPRDDQRLECSMN